VIASIFEVDFVAGSKEKIRDFTGTIPELKKELVTLQRDWCDRERPQLKQVTDFILEVRSNCDFGHIAFIKE
jgi:hypothetical protein